MAKKTAIALSYGDGIGPEIMTACLKILEAAGANLEYHPVEVGEKVFLSGRSDGIDPGAWEILRKTGVFYKAPVTTPQGGGFKSINVTMRKTLGLYANVRPVTSFHPFVATKHPQMDMVIVRENEEDLYAGIEHRQTDEVYQTLKLISRPASERICHYAFEYARRNGRNKVTCFTKDNIMKMTDGLFHKSFDRVGEQYPEIEKEHWIIDIGAAKTATEPENFDIIVMPNLYGDVVSDIVAQLTGSVGLAGSANVGEKFAMFEAIHGSAPDIAGRGIANPSGLLLGGVMMLVHIGQTEVATNIHNAWLRTIEDGVHTVDIYNEKVSKQRVTTDEFTQAVIERLGQKPEQLKPVHYEQVENHPMPMANIRRNTRTKQLVGVDVFLDWGTPENRDPDELGHALEALNDERLQLIMITNRGQKVFPHGVTATLLTDHWRCRFQSPAEMPISLADIINLLQRFHDAHYDVIKTENLYMFDGQRGYSLGQGQIT